MIENRANLIAVILACWAMTGQVFGFSGSGRESYLEAQKYLGLRRLNADEQQALSAMSETDRLTKAAEALADAERNASTEQETENVGRALANTYNRLGVAAAESKDYRNAIYYLQESIKRNEKSPIIYMNLGECQYAAGEYYEAACSLSKAKELGAPADLKDRICKGLIITFEAQAKSNDSRGYDEAIREIESQLGERPNDVQLLLLLGRNQLAKGDLAKAVDTWEKARKQGPLQEYWETQYQRAKSALAIKTDKQFAQEQSAHFVLEFDEKAKAMAGLAKKFLDWLEEAYDDAGMKFEVRPSQKIFVTIYASADYDEAVKVSWSGGVHEDNRITIRVMPKGDDATYRDIIFHEWTHHVVAMKAGQKHVPTWFNEGLALLSTPTGARVTSPAFLEKVIKVKGKYIPFKAIDATFMNLPTDKHVRLAYTESHSIVSKMVDRFGWGQLMKVLSQLATGNDFYETFHLVTRVNFSDYEKEWFEEIRGAHAEPPPADGPGFDGLNSGAAPTSPATAPPPGAEGR